MGYSGKENPVRAGAAARLTGVVTADVPLETTSRDLGNPNRRSLEERFRAGEAGALEEVVWAYQPRLARLVYRLSGWRSGEAEDVVQEVFVAAVRSAKRFDGRSSLATWLTRIAINACRTERRRRVLRGRYWKELVRRRPGREWAQGADERADERERARRVVEEARRLPGKYREVVVLRYLEGMEVEEVARALGVGKGAVEVRLHRARGMLREALGAEMEE